MYISKSIGEAVLFIVLAAVATAYNSFFSFLCLLLALDAGMVATTAVKTEICYVKYIKNRIQLSRTRHSFSNIFTQKL